MLYHSSQNLIEDCAKYIIDFPSDTIVLLPTQDHTLPLKSYIVKNLKGTMEFPKIFTIEGIDISSIINCTEEFISRNVVFGVLYDLTRRCNILQEEEISVFVRSMLGELPNLYAHNIMPDDIINNIPASVLMKYEVNVNLFTKIWRAFEIFLCEANLLPYYTKQTILLEKLLNYALKNHIHLVIVDDFGSSPILKNFIEKIIKTNINTTLFQAKNEKTNNNLYTVQTPYLIEQKSILLTAKYILENNNAKIGIVCEDELLKSMISIELENENINHCVNLSVSLESNPFIRFFIYCVDSISLLEMLSQLKIDNAIKHQILISELSSQTINCEIWHELIAVYEKKFPNYEEYIKNIFNFMITKNNFFIFLKEEYIDFLQFQNFLLNEIKALNHFKIMLNKDFIKNVINSWKIFEKKQDTNVMILPLKNLHLFEFDTIILTTGYKTEIKGNVIFSNGMRQYYGFASNDLTIDFLQKYYCSNFLYIR